MGFHPNLHLSNCSTFNKHLQKKTPNWLFRLNPQTSMWVATDPSGILQVRPIPYQMVHYFDTPCIPQVARWHYFHTHKVFLIVNFSDKIKFFPKKYRAASDPCKVTRQYVFPSGCHTSQRGWTCASRIASVRPANWLATGRVKLFWRHQRICDVVYWAPAV